LRKELRNLSVFALEVFQFLGIFEAGGRDSGKKFAATWARWEGQGT